jgi:hypothetical protein
MVCDDLKTLCLTSELYNGRAVSLLSKRVYVRLWNREEVVRFIHCMASSAFKTLEYTRTLIIGDERFPVEPHVNTMPSKTIVHRSLE